MHSWHFGLSLSALTLVATSIGVAEDHSWYTSAKMSCSDPLALGITLRNGQWFKRYPQLTFVRVSQSEGYAEIDQFEYKKLLVDPLHQGVLETLTLGAGDAATLRTFLRGEADKSTVAITGNAVTLLTTYINSPANIVLNGFLSYLSSQDEVVKTNAQVLAEVMVKGANIEQDLSIAQASNKRAYVAYSFNYKVAIGQEIRSYVLYSCTYPVKINFSRFETKSTRNNKVFRRVSENGWERIDVDSGRVEQKLVQSERDDNYIYLIEDNPADRIHDTYRISFWGGPWQTRHEDGSWGTLCSEVATE